jgi:putative aldouronate transport system permease protein
MQVTHELDAPLAASTAKRNRKKSSIFFTRLWRDRWTYLLLLPGLLYLLIFYYLPLLGNVIAFQDYSPYLGFFHSTWIGLANFTTVFTDPAFGVVISNTLIISFLQIIFAFPVGIILALMLNALVSERFKRFMQSVLYLPHFLGWVIIISIWQQIVGGDSLVSHLLATFGVKSFDLMTNPNFFKPLVVLQVIWKESGWSTILFLAAITSIDPALYEAAAIDGANKWRRMWHVTLPGMRTVIVMLLILRIGTVLSSGFEQIFLQRTGVGLNAAEVIDTFVYDRAIINGNWGVAAAIALLKTVVGAILIYGSNRLVKSLGEDGLF